MNKYAEVRKQFDIPEDALIPVEYIGYQEGFDNVPGFHMVNDPTGSTLRYNPDEHIIMKSRRNIPIPEDLNKYDEVGAIIAYESGELFGSKFIELFQHLVDNGHAWTLQGHYGRVARQLIESGHVTQKAKA